MGASITAIATAVPEFKKHQSLLPALVCSNLDLDEHYEKLLQDIYDATGIINRYSIFPDGSLNNTDVIFFPNKERKTFLSTSERMQIYKEHAPTLAVKAIKQCLAEKEDISPSDVTHLITVSCTGMYAPGLDIDIVQQLKFRSETKRFAINFMGCYGAFNGLKVAEAICKAYSTAKVLVICVELCSIHFQEKLTMNNIISNALFSDGAACALIEGNVCSKPRLAIEDFHSDLLPQSSSTMAWDIADNGFEMVLTSFVPKLIESGIGDFAKNLLIKLGLSISDIEHFAIHPGGKQILISCENALSLSKHDNRHSYQVLKDYGNMSSATVLFVLRKILSSVTKDNHAQNVFSCAFGPGLALESALFKIIYS